MERLNWTTRHLREIDWRSERALAVITGIIAGCFLAIGVSLVLWGGTRLWIFGWILAIWGVAGLASAVLIAMRAPRT